MPKIILSLAPHLFANIARRAAEPAPGKYLVNLIRRDIGQTQENQARIAIKGRKQ